MSKEINIPFFKNYYSEKDIKYVNKVIQRGMYWANGPEIKEFEKRIAEFVGSRYCVAFNSGTSALHSVLLAYDVEDKEVIVPSFTFIATANSVLHAGGKPVFADIENETFGLDPEDVKEKIGPKTKVIMPVHYGGCSCRIKALKEIAEDHKLILIEDAAEALGAKYSNKMVGSFGDAAIFSFTPTKVISTGEGGAIVLNNKKLFEKIKLIYSHGRLETEDYFSSVKYMDYITLGYNFRMPSVCAAQGLAQLENIKKIINMRRKVIKQYNIDLKNIKSIRTPKEPSNCFHIYQMYSILVKNGRNIRNELQKFLKERGITSRVYFEPVHKTFFYEKELKYEIKLKNTEEMAGMILSLPVYPTMNENEARYVTKKTKEFLD